MSSPSQRENGKELVGGPRHERLPRHRVRSDPSESTPAAGRPRPWWPIVTAILVVGIAVSALVPAGRHQWALSLFRQPTPYTALSFDDPTSLPTAAQPGDFLAFTFSITNHEGHSVHYAYDGDLFSRKLDTDDLDDDCRQWPDSGDFSQRQPAVQRDAVPDPGDAPQAESVDRLFGLRSEGPDEWLNREVLVTTSWDDGHQLDMKLAGVLRDCGCKGTFYVSPLSHEIPARARLRAADLRDLSATFEVGSHTLTHPHLTRLSPLEAAHEISDGRRAVEDIINRSATSFCYPYGAYDPEHVGMVRDAGCLVGRTIRRFNVGSDGDPLQMATTTHASRYKADALRIARHSLADEAAAYVAQLGCAGPERFPGGLYTWRRDPSLGP